MPTWNWTSQGSPSGLNPAPGSGITYPVGAVTVRDTPTSPQQIYVFALTGSTSAAGNLWVNRRNGSATWSWEDHGNPPGVGLNGAQGIGVVTVKDTPTSPQRPYAFVLLPDGNVWANWLDGSNNWTWKNHGKPAGSSNTRPVGVVTMMDTPTSRQRPYVFVRCADGLWVNWFGEENSQLDWRWTYLGQPATNTAVEYRAGVVTMMDTPVSPQRPYVFVRCSGGNLDGLWVKWWGMENAQWDWRWTNLSKPPGVTINWGNEAVTMMDNTTSPQRPYVFVRCSDGNLWVKWWGVENSQWDWRWTSLSKPLNVTINSPIASFTKMDTPTSPQRPHALVRGSDGKMWRNIWNASSQHWEWQDGGKPSGLHVGLSFGVVKIMDTPTSEERPYVFVGGTTVGGGENSGLLFCNWWG